MAGIDPISERKVLRRAAALNDSNSFEAIAREWHELNQDKWDGRYRKYIIHRLEMDIFPKTGSMSIASIKPINLLAALRKIEKRGAGEIVRRTLNSYRQIFAYALITERVERNPAIDLQGALKPMKCGHYAAIETDELPTLVQPLERNNARLSLSDDLFNIFELKMPASFLVIRKAADIFV